MKKDLFVLSNLLGVFLLAGAAFAQEGQAGKGVGSPINGPQKVRPTNTFGSTETYVRISYSQFTAQNGSPYVDNGTGGASVNRYTIGYGQLVSALQLPAGAMIDYVELDSCEFNASEATSMYLLDCLFPGNFCSMIPGTNLSATANSMMCGSSPVFPTAYGPVDNFFHEYLVGVTTPAGDGSESLSGVIIGYHIQVSPPPGSATFLDVPTTSPIFRFVEALAVSGITAGCDATHYCPAAPLTRGQMAVYLATALGLAWD